MDPSDESFYLLLCMFIVGCAMLGFVLRWYKQWKDPVERVMTRDEAKECFARLMSERIGIAMRAAELDAVIMEKWAEWPLEYQVPLQRILRESQILEDNLYAEAAERGIYPKRITTHGYLVPPVTADPEQQPSSVAASDSNVVALGGRRWLGNQLLRTS